MKDALNNSTQPGNDSQCAMYPTPYLDTQFYLVFMFGSVVAMLSLVNNVLLVHIFWSRPRFREKHYFYLFVLSAFDILTAVAYIAVFSTCIFFEKTNNLTVMRVWYAYVIPAFTITHIGRCSSIFLLVAVSLERFLSANWFSGFCTLRKRTLIVLAVVLLSVVFRGTTPFEIRVKHRPYCKGLASKILMPTQFLGSDFGQFWTFWVRNFGTILVPFLLLLSLNFGIVYRDKCACLAVSQEDGEMNLVRTVRQVKMRFQRTVSLAPQQNGMGNISAILQTASRNAEIRNSVATEWVRRARNRVHRTATRTLIAIISTFLIVSSLSVVVTVWEHVDAVSLQERLHFYTIASDFVSILTVFASAARLPTYLACDPRFRQEFLALHCSCLPSKAKRKQKQLAMHRTKREQSSRGLSAVALKALHQKRSNHFEENNGFNKEKNGGSNGWDLKDQRVVRLSVKSKTITRNFRVSEDESHSEMPKVSFTVPSESPVQSVELPSPKEITHLLSPEPYRNGLQTPCKSKSDHQICYSISQNGLQENVPLIEIFPDPPDRNSPADIVDSVQFG